MDPAALPAVLAGCKGPTLVCVQAGNVNSGAVDPMEPLIAPPTPTAPGSTSTGRSASGERRAPPGGAAGGVENRRQLGGGRAQVAQRPLRLGRGHRARSRAALRPRGGRPPRATWCGPRDCATGWTSCPSSAGADAGRRSTPRSGRWAGGASRRWWTAAARLPGASREQLGRVPGVHVLNEVVLNQVLVRFDPPGGGDADAFTREVIARVQADGTCWLGGSKWKGPGRDADQRLGLEHHRGGRGSVRGGHPALRWTA